MIQKTQKNTNLGGRCWTVSLVEKRLVEAAETLKRLPNHHPGRHLASSWPDIVQNADKSYTDHSGYQTPAVPAASAIDRMDEVLMEWNRLLDMEEVQILWTKLLGIQDVTLAKRLGVHRVTIYRKRKSIAKKLVDLLNNKLPAALN